MTDQTESEYAELLAQADFNTTNLVASLAAAIRALEAKAAAAEAAVRDRNNAWIDACADRIRLAGEVERLTGGVEFWRGSHAKVTEANARLTSELAAAREELAQRREHMRRGMPMGVATNAARRAGEGEK